MLGAEQFYAHLPVDGLGGRAPDFYQWRTGDGFVSDVRSGFTAMPSTREAVDEYGREFDKLTNRRQVRV